jgi:hypothetical protein
MLPKAKVLAAALGGALATIVVWVIQTYGGIEIPGDVSAALATIFAFVVGYLTPEPFPEPGEGQGYIEVDVLPDEPG